MNFSSNPGFRMFEELYYITLEKKLFLFHQILGSISKAFFSSSLSTNIFTKEWRALHLQKKLKDVARHQRQISSQEELLTFQFLWFLCGEKINNHSPCTVYVMVYVQEIYHEVHLPDLSIFCISVSTQCLVPINNNFLSINNHSSTHTLLGLFDT